MSARITERLNKIGLKVILPQNLDSNGNIIKRQQAQNNDNSYNNRNEHRVQSMNMNFEQLTIRQNHNVVYHYNTNINVRNGDKSQITNYQNQVQMK